MTMYVPANKWCNINILNNDRKYMHTTDKTVVLDASLLIMILLSVLDVNSSPVVFYIVNSMI